MQQAAGLQWEARCLPVEMVFLFFHEGKRNLTTGRLYSGLAPPFCNNISVAFAGMSIFPSFVIHTLASMSGAMKRLRRVRWPDGRGGRKSVEESPGSTKDTVTDNIRRGRPQGQRHRNDTAYRPKAAARLKWCGKSAPRLRRRRRHGKPHREQDQIGTAGDLSFGSPSGSVARGERQRSSQRNGHRFASVKAQNPAYRPSDALGLRAH